MTTDDGSDDPTDDPGDTRTDPPPDGDEAAVLVGFLEYHRATFRR